MLRLAVIAAVSQNGAIGKDGDLPWHFSADMKRFRELTWGSIVIVGRKTHEAIGRALPGRINIVVTRQKDYDQKARDCVVAHSVEEALAYAKEKAEAGILAGKTGEVFCIGGAELYRQMLPLADKIYLTRINKDFNGDAFFPEIDMNVWRGIYCSCVGWQGEEPDRYLAYFLEFDKSKVVPLDQ